MSGKNNQAQFSADACLLTPDLSMFMLLFSSCTDCPIGQEDSVLGMGT